MEQRSDPSKLAMSDLTPINLCLKFKPPSISLYYRHKLYPGLKFMHTVDLTKEVEAFMSGEEIYNKLLKNESEYWNRDKISKDQITKLVNKLLNNQSIIISKMLKQAQSEKTENEPKQIYLEESDYKLAVESALKSTNSIVINHTFDTEESKNANKIKDTGNSSIDINEEKYDSVVERQIYNAMLKSNY